jgi:TonB family protein
MAATDGGCTKRAAGQARRGGAGASFRASGGTTGAAILRRRLRAGFALLPALLAAGRATASVQPSSAPYCILGGLAYDGSEAGDLLASAARASGDASNVAAEMTRGIDLLRRCNPPAAAAAFRQADELSGGGCGACRLGEALAIGQTGALEPALAATRAAIDRLGGDPLLGRAWGQLANLLLLQQTPAAESEAESALQAAADAGGSFQATALSRLAAVRLHRQHYPEAIETARRAIAADPKGQAGGAAHSTICLARRAGYTDRPAAGRSQDRGRSAASPERDEPYRLEEGIQRPTGIYTPAPRYTETARKARVQGIVVLEVVIDEVGCVAEEKVLKGQPMGLDQAAVTAIRGWAYEPATREGRPVRSVSTLTVNFQIDGSKPEAPAAVTDNPRQ